MSRNDKCAHPRCGWVRWNHDNVPRGYAQDTGPHHAFVEPTAQSPQAIQRGDPGTTGGDNEMEIAKRWSKEWEKWRGNRKMTVDMVVVGAAREAYAAGRARGIEEGATRLAKEQREVADCLYEMMAKEPLGSHKRRDLSLRASERYAIADAITKETQS